MNSELQLIEYHSHVTVPLSKSLPSHLCLGTLVSQQTYSIRKIVSWKPKYCPVLAHRCPWGKAIRLWNRMYFGCSEIVPAKEIDRGANYTHHSTRLDGFLCRIMKITVHGTALTCKYTATLQSSCRALNLSRTGEICAVGRHRAVIVLAWGR